MQIDWVNQWTAAAGSTVYDGGAWPAKWGPEERYSFFMSEATMHLFHHEFLDWNGATLKGRREDGRKETEFFTGGNDYWFRPIHARVGPDGAMYVVDFYNQIAVHNDTRGPKHGPHNAAIRPDDNGPGARARAAASAALGACARAGARHGDLGPGEDRGADGMTPAHTNGALLGAELKIAGQLIPDQSVLINSIPMLETKRARSHLSMESCDCLLCQLARLCLAPVKFKTHLALTPKLADC